MSYHYHDDPVEESAVRRILPKFIAASVLMLFTFFYYQTTLASNIALNSSSTIEFGQSVSATAACAGSDNLLVTPKSSFVNAANGAGTYYLSSVQVAGIPASCEGKDFNVSFYDSVTGSSALPIFGFFGDNKSVVTVYNNAGYFQQGFQSTGIELSSASGAFTVTFKTPVALSTDAMKVTLQSTEHKNWAEASISSSQYFTCALLDSSGMKCWGSNANGILGDGTATQRNAPVNVSGLTSGVTAIGTGPEHACAVLDTGAVKCWGWNGNGRLGNGALSGTSTTPVDVVSLAARAIAVDGGQYFTCALLITGQVQCWGQSYYGQLGGNNNSGTDYGTPQNVSNINNAVAISTGYTHACALLSTGAVQCWGLNTSGQLGDGTITQRNTPRDVLNFSNAVAISAGAFHTCAVLSSGKVHCWGINTNGQLGMGSSGGQANSSLEVSGITNAVAISAGVSHTCALLSTGAVQCWGLNADGQLGDGTTAQKLIPTAITTLTSGVRAIGTGLDHSCAVLSTGAARCWGGNDQGQVGDNTEDTDRTTPRDVSGIP